jgi:hypothetical protein
LQDLEPICSIDTIVNAKMPLMDLNRVNVTSEEKYLLAATIIYFGVCVSKFQSLKSVPVQKAYFLSSLIMCFAVAHTLLTIQNNREAG